MIEIDPPEGGTADAGLMRLISAARHCRELALNADPVVAAALIREAQRLDAEIGRSWRATEAPSAGKPAE